MKYIVHYLIVANMTFRMYLLISSPFFFWGGGWGGGGLSLDIVFVLK